MTHQVLAASGSTLDGVWDAVFIIGLLLVWLSAIALAIMGTVNALSYPAELWQQVGARRILWVWQAVGVLATPLSLVYSGFYFLQIRPRLVTAAGQNSIRQMDAYANYVPSAVAARDGRTLVRIRIPLSQHLKLLAFAAVLFGLVGLFEFGDSHFLSTFGGAALGAALGIGLRTIGTGVDLTPTHAVVRNIRRRSILWSDIAAVAPERTFGTRRVILWTTSGKRLALRAPVTDFLLGGRARYERDLRTIGQWWLDHRSAPA